MSEYSLHVACVNYLHIQHRALWYSDLNGVKLSMGTAVKVKRIQHPKMKWLDLFIPEPRRGYHGLFIELKQEVTGAHGYALKNGGLKQDAHILAQTETMEYLRKRGYLARFCGGFEEFRELVDWYFCIEIGSQQ